MWKEFRAFAFKGNVLDLAIGVVIGAAFGKIVTSIVNDLITPIIGIIIGGLNFSGLSLVVGDSQIKYGSFIQTVIDFLLTAASIFIFIKLLGRLKKKEEDKPAAPPAPSREEVLLTEIRDLLKQQRQES
ncbi:large conductance mechanosensitive channel protein MscL [Paenibacillus physcomitrellae]|uniref:Large-conductance mechanosensitive channel n=1 Tax=Paenibacillus physcomitrellae TaxID=1619311 RepID=A0ABQ1GAN4_9BACL|nr:large conductance mechanosensitive channel protein MscL [Paenibacillus physcomitrellae]GGA39913.1 large-conductance mechanosensitive channel [Paenibacillus physcomitrellae]